jgi:peptidoglycan/xylan/chitin deacetylase (PgdA/CDA1 family)
MRALAIMYHDVVEDGDFESSGFPGEGANVYKLRREDFERHLDAIGSAVPKGRVTTISPTQHAVVPEVFLTFDDGGVSAANPIAGLLESRGWRGHFFVTTDRIGKPGFLSAHQIRELYLRGHAIGSHSHTHPTRMAALTRAEIDEEWRRSVGALSSILRVEVKLASVPGGYYSRQVGESAAAAGIEALFTSEPTMEVGIGTGCLVIGRYVIQRGMGPEWSGGLAARRRRFRWHQTLLWEAKRAAKWLGGSAYLRLRQEILEK